MNLLEAGVYQLCPQSLIILSCKTASLQCRNEPNLLAENILGQGFGLPGLIALFVFIEEFKIPTVVKDQKSPFVGIFTVDLIHTGQPLAQTGSPADHLPELCFGTHLLEEHQVHTLGHVDTSVHHIHRNCNMWFLFRLLEIVNDLLGIAVLTDHPLGKGSMVLGIELIEPIQDKLGMALVLGEDDGLAQPVAACHFDAPLHQVLKYQVHRSLIEDELIELFRGDILRHGAILGEIRLIAFFILIGQVIISDAFLQKLGLDLVVVVGHQDMVLIHCRFVIVGVGGDAALHLKKVVGVPVDVGLGSGGQPNQNGIEILKDSPVFLEDAPMALVDDNQVKMGGGEQLPPVRGFGVVNGIQDRGIG